MISIIIPVYNAEPYLDQCIESVTSQIYKDWECILINDGSKDSSGSICDKWSQRDQRIRVVHQLNKGVSVARNRGIKESKGEFIVFIDSDDWVEPNYLSDLIDNMIENIDIIISGNNQYKQNKKIITYKPTNKNIIEFSSNSTAAFIKNIELLYGPYSKLYRTKTIKKNNILFPEDYSLGEDLLFNFQYLNYTQKIGYIPKANYNYRILNAGSLTSIYRDNTFDIHYHLYLARKSFFINKKIWNSISKRYLFNQLWGIIYDALFYKKNITYKNIKSILEIEDIKELRLWSKDFNCSKWIKFLILHKQCILLYLFFKFNKK